MSRGSKSHVRKRPGQKSASARHPYPSLSNGPSPKERLRDLVSHAGKPMAAQDYENHIAEFRDLWGSDEEIDAFIGWLHRARRSGRYE